ncbi:MAG: hypothetical protein Q9N34_05955 [Aquificota bacterium]|nr:hypothetical protein [Aquificota bacterium]
MITGTSAGKREVSGCEYCRQAVYPEGPGSTMKRISYCRGPEPAGEWWDGREFEDFQGEQVQD